MKLRNKGSHITNLAEGSAPVNKNIQITRWLYFLALISFVCYLVYLGVMRFTQFEGRGHVEIERTLISPSKGGQLIGLFVKEGDTLKKGAALARIKEPTNCKPADTKERDKLRLDIQTKNVEVKILKNRIATETRRLQNSELRRVLELDTNQANDRLRSIRTIEDLNYKMDELAGEIFLLESAHRTLASTDTYIANTNCLDEIIYAPFDGAIHSILHKQFEFSPKGKPLIVLIADKAPVYIDAFVNNEDSSYLSIDKVVDVTFPNGLQSQGVVKKISSASAYFPEIKFDKYESVESNVRIRILPLDDTEEKLWRANDKMDVTLTGAAQ